MGVYLIVAAILAVFVGLYANKRGFSFWGYFFLSFIATPVIALITLRTARKNPERKEGEDTQASTKRRKRRRHKYTPTELNE